MISRAVQLARGWLLYWWVKFGLVLGFNEARELIYTCKAGHRHYVLSFLAFLEDGDASDTAEETCHVHGK